MKNIKYPISTFFPILIKISRDVLTKKMMILKIDGNDSNSNNKTTTKTTPLNEQTSSGLSVYMLKSDFDNFKDKAVS